MKGQQESFHNAFIAEVLDSSDDFSVKVFFLNPLCDKQKACDYYFDGRCTFEDSCKFSHGETVKYSRLKQYIPPNYKLLKRKTHVLVKVDNLWKPATILESSKKLKNCQVKLHSGVIFDCSFSDILPPTAVSETQPNSDLSSNDSDEDDDTIQFPVVLQIDDKFGEWEKHTTGFGSKLLEKYGYVSGTGLGIRGNGITEPVSARVYVQGKSLDYNMELNEKRAQMTVEQQSRKESLKHQKISESNSTRNENRVFDFLNSTICKIKPSTSTANVPKAASLKSQSKAELNIGNFKLEEDIKKVDSRISKLNESLSRQQKGSAVHKNIQHQVNEQRQHLEQLRKTLKANETEQKTRRENSKLTVF